jgi:hypothetical protein
MKRLLTPKNAAAAATNKAADTLESLPKKSRNKAHDRPQAVTALLHNGWTDLGQQALVGYWPRKLSGMSQAAMSALLKDIQWQQVRPGVVRLCSSWCKEDIHVGAVCWGFCPQQAGRICLNQQILVTYGFQSQIAKGARVRDAIPAPCVPCLLHTPCNPHRLLIAVHMWGVCAEEPGDIWPHRGAAAPHCLHG